VYICGHLWFRFFFRLGLILGFFGREIYRQAPPIPTAVVTESGKTLITESEILDGQQVWQSIGGQQIGSIWGHGAYQAPDWSADWLHREATALLDTGSRAEHGGAVAELSAENRGMLENRLQREMRTNRLAPDTGVRTVSAARAAAIDATAAHYRALFGADAPLDGLREDYALHDDAVTDPEPLNRLPNFFSGPRGPAPPSGLGSALPIRTIGRTSRWWVTIRPRPASCGRCSASCCCSQPLAEWCGSTRRPGSTTSRCACPSVIRWLGC
jgi:hypothetical protein